MTTTLLTLLCLPFAVWSLSTLLGLGDNRAMAEGLLQLALAVLLWLLLLGFVGNLLATPLTIALAIVVTAHMSHWLLLRLSARLS